MSKRLDVRYSREDGEAVAAQARKGSFLEIAIKLQLRSGLREGEIFGNNCYGKGTKYFVKNDPNPHYSKPSLKPLTPMDLDLDHSSIRLNGKGGTFITQPIDTETCQLLRSYIIRCRTKPNQALCGMTTRAYQNNVRRLARIAGIQNAEYFTTHKLRAIFITYVGRKKGPLVAQQLARHRNITMTSRYMRPTDAEKKTDYNELFN